MLPKGLFLTLCLHQAIKLPESVQNDLETKTRKEILYWVQFSEGLVIDLNTMGDKPVSRQCLDYYEKSILVFQEGQNESSEYVTALR